MSRIQKKSKWFGLLRKTESRPRRLCGEQLERREMLAACPVPVPPFGLHPLADVLTMCDEVGLAGAENLNEARIEGVKFEDMNANAVLDEDEVGMAGVTVYLDLNHDGEMDGDEPRTVTLLDGSYEFANLSAATYTVAELVPPGSRQTFPSTELADYVTAQRVARGLSRPIYVTAPPGDTDRLFIVEQHSGRIRILDVITGSVNATPFLTVSGLSTGNEQGLLGMAFDPDYDSNGFFYVNFTDTGRTTNVRRYQVSATDPDRADASSAMTVLTISQPQSNHNGGWIGFGPDGLLYLSSGDGGGSNDSGSGHTAGTGNAQDITNNLLGKILRIDVDGDGFPADASRNYAIPSTNPFVGITGDDEIWAYGLRNPWRSSFDRLTGELYIADVGQNAREEIDVQAADSTGGENYGWRLREGTIATPTGGVGGPVPPGAVDPIYDYLHGGGSDQGFSVTGGYAYRGPIQGLEGKYFFADYVTDRIWSIQHDGTGVTEFMDWTTQLTPDAGTIDNISSFGEDALGNLYVVGLDGEVFRVVQTGLPGTHTVEVGIDQVVTEINFGNQRIVTDVHVRGSTWNSNVAPYRLLANSEPGLPLPSINLDRIDVIFDRDVAVDIDWLTLSGVATPAYVPSDFVYDAASFTATWSFAAGLVDDRFRLDLFWSTAELDPAVVPRGPVGRQLDAEHDLQLRFDVLAGDVTGDGITDISDLVNIASRVPSSIGPPSDGPYDRRFDVNGDGSIDIGDLVNTATRVPRQLPLGER